MRERPRAGSKRGGGVTTVPLDFQSAEGELVRHEPPVAADVDDLFYQEWVRALFQRAVDDLRKASDSSGRTTMFAVFERYDLADHAERPTYATIARELGLTSSDGDESSRGDAATVSPACSRSAARSDDDR